MWYRKKPFSLDVVSEKTVKFRCGVGIFRYVPFPIPEWKLFLTVMNDYDQRHSPCTILAEVE
jgi:hypothetical protein